MLLTFYIEAIESIKIFLCGKVMSDENLRVGVVRLMVVVVGWEM